MAAAAAGGGASVLLAPKQHLLCSCTAGPPSLWTSPHWTCLSWCPWSGEMGSNGSILALGASHGQLLLLSKRETADGSSSSRGVGSSRGDGLGGSRGGGGVVMSNRGAAGGSGLSYLGWEVGCRIEGKGPPVLQVAWQPAWKHQGADAGRCCCSTSLSS
jgi:hypothetical protein